MEFVYKRAGLEDIELLVKTRIEALRAANCLSDDTEMPFVELQSRVYYEECLQAETHISLEATDMGRPFVKGAYMDIILEKVEESKKECFI